MEVLNDLVRKVYKHFIAVVSGYNIPKLKLQERDGATCFKKKQLHIKISN